METLTKQQKQAVEKAELAQQQDMKATAKRIKAEQVKNIDRDEELFVLITSLFDGSYQNCVWMFLSARDQHHLKKG